MSKIVEDFLGEVKEQKIKQLMGISLDTNYWTSVIGDKDVDELRTELGLEKEKMVLNKNGKINADNRDMDKINHLNKEINTLEKAFEELARMKEMGENINLYMEFVNNPNKDTLELLEEIAKL